MHTPSYYTLSILLYLVCQSLTEEKSRLIYWLIDWLIDCRNNERQTVSTQFLPFCQNWHTFLPCCFILTPANEVTVVYYLTLYLSHISGKLGLRGITQGSQESLSIWHLQALLDLWSPTYLSETNPSLSQLSTMMPFQLYFCSSVYHAVKGNQLPMMTSRSSGARANGMCELNWKLCNCCI